MSVISFILFSKILTSLCCATFYSFSFFLSHTPQPTHTHTKTDREREKEKKKKVRPSSFLLTHSFIFIIIIIITIVIHCLLSLSLIGYCAGVTDGDQHRHHKPTERERKRNWSVDFQALVYVPASGSWHELMWDLWHP